MSVWKGDGAKVGGTSLAGRRKVPAVRLSSLYYHHRPPFSVCLSPGLGVLNEPIQLSRRLCLK